MFDKMAQHGCTPDAVTYANLIRAYKKGGQWCAAVNTFERMQARSWKSSNGMRGLRALCRRVCLSATVFVPLSARGQPQRVAKASLM
jgi:pentatricopeptide repeat protein